MTKSRRKLQFALFIILMVVSGLVLKQTDQTALKGAYLDGKFPSKGNSAWYFEKVYDELPEEWDGLLFTRIKRIPGTNNLIAVGKEGHIWSFDKDNEEIQPRLLMDLSDQVINLWDAGIMDLEFHPDFGLADSTHRNDIFIFYTYQPPPLDNSLPLYNRLCKFEFSESRDSIFMDSEEILISQFDRQVNHNGGAMFFDNDGLLYVSLGDEGSHKDNYNNSQKIDKALFSGLIRIDVDLDSSRSHSIRRSPVNWGIPNGYPKTVTQNYMIPNDNPWVNEDGLYLEEFYSIGLRSPHSSYYDSLTGNIFVADVGQDHFEEINILSESSNGQWAYMEGNAEGYKTKPDSIIGIETPPVFSYGRELGRAVIGGEVYRGSKHPSILGKYLFADYGSGNVWTLNPETLETVIFSLIPDEGYGVVSFYFDDTGDVYAILLDGHMLKLIHNVANEPPALLSETGAFDSLETLEPSVGIIEYDVNTPLWSDWASKKRWIALPREGKIAFSNDSSWQFPEGTVFIKHFDMQIATDSVVKLETRFLIIDEDRKSYGLTYKWNEDGSDAHLIENGSLISDELAVMRNGVFESQTWDYPSRAQCLECHNSSAGYVLGVKTSQLNNEVSNLERNQLVNWNGMGFFESPLEDSSIVDLPRNVKLSDSLASFENRVRSYLDANCSFCHNPSGVEAAFDARISTPLKFQNIVNHEAIGRNSTEGNSIVKPLDLFKSELWQRDVTLGQGQMPPLAKNVLDEQYLNILAKWILSLEPYNIEKDTTICANETMTFDDGTVIDSITADFRHANFFISSLGIDSTIYVDVEVLDNYYSEQDFAVCFGSEYTFPDGTVLASVEEPIEHQSDLMTISGCDSIILSRLTINEIYFIEQDSSVCHGSDYIFPDGTVLELVEGPVEYQSNLLTQNGCDSIIISNLTTMEVMESTSIESIDFGGSYDLPDGSVLHNISKDTIVSVPLVSNNGCDSIVNIALKVLMPLNSQYTTSEISLYPNPNKGEFRIDLGTRQPEINVVVKNITGAISEERHFSNKQYVDLNIYLEAGIYLVFVEVDQSFYKCLKFQVN